MGSDVEIAPKNYVCKSCNTMKIAPKHCGRSMSVEVQDDGSYWICWKGDHAPCCGRESFEKIEDCCDNTQLTAEIDKSKILL